MRRLVGRITRFEIIVGVVIAAGLLVLVLIEPDILEAPFENWRTVLFTFGGTALAAIAFVVMLRFRVPAVARVMVLVVPFAIVNWWLLSPYFVDDVVDEGFAASISEQLGTADETPATSAPAELEEDSTTDSTPTTAAVEEEAEGSDGAAPEEESVSSEVTTTTTTAPATTTTMPSGPVLLGAGQFVGLAGHSGTGDAGLFQNPDGSLVLRFENFDIENGPDLEVYLVPGPDQTSLPEGSIHLGALKGNIGDQNYELPAGTELVPGAYTALVWCEAFSVEFVGATIEI